MTNQPSAENLERAERILDRNLDTTIMRQRAAFAIAQALDEAERRGAARTLRVTRLWLSRNHKFKDIANYLTSNAIELERDT